MKYRFEISGIVEVEAPNIMIAETLLKRKHKLLGRPAAVVAGMAASVRMPSQQHETNYPLASVRTIDNEVKIIRCTK